MMTERKRRPWRQWAWAVLAASLVLALAGLAFPGPPDSHGLIDELTALALVSVASLAAAFLALTPH